MKWKYPILTVICLIFLIIYSFSLYLVSFQYERLIGSHIENAFEVNTPTRMIEEIKLAKQGIIEADLKETDYGAWIFKKPDNSMKFQYEFLDSIIERAEAVEIWYQTTYSGNATATEQLGDVYEQKMDNLREFLHEGGRADWIAQDAWYVKNHLLIYLFGFWGIVLLGLLMFFGTVASFIDNEISI